MKAGLSQGSTTDSLDPSQLTSFFTQVMFYSYLNQLTEVTPSGEIVPLLAESWEASPDGVQWSFDLRKDVQFHNGKTLDADDVMASLAIHQGEDSKSQMKAFAEQISEMRKDGPNRVILTLKEGNADFPAILSAQAFGILPVENGEVQATAGIGTGAYVIENFDPGVNAEFTRNPNYFRDDVGFVDSSELIVIADSAARQSALITGEIDLTDTIDLKTIKKLEEQENVNILNVTGALHYDFPMRTDTAPFDNNDVRMALKYAVDREEILSKLLQGYGTLGNDQPISSAYRYFDSGIEQRAYDPEKAKFHLKKSGNEGLSVQLSASHSVFPGAVDMALLYSEQAKKAGIDIKVFRAPDDGYWSDVWLKHPWCASLWSGRPTEDMMLTQAYSQESTWNETFWDNERFNNLLKAARAEFDEKKRAEMYSEMQLLIRDDGGAVVPVFADHTMGLTNSVGHPEKVAGNWVLDGCKFMERWWIT